MKSLKDILYQIEMKMNLEDKSMKVELTQREIDRIYFDLIDYVKTSCYVDKLKDLSLNDKEEYRIELDLIEKFSRL